VYSSSLADLAALPDPVMADVGPLFERALAELELPLPSRAEAAWLIARHCMESILSDSGSVHATLGLLKDASQAASDVLPDKEYVGSGLDLGCLIGIYYSHDEPNENYYEPENRVITDERERQAILERDARREAFEWLRRHRRS
jgi:hypothetical protein